MAGKSGWAGKSSRHILFNAHIAVETNQPDKALRLLEQLNVEELSIEQQAAFYSSRGEAYFKLDHFQLARQDLEKALGLYRLPELDSATPLQIAQLRNLLAATYYQENIFHEALRQHTLCLQAITDGYITENRFKLKLFNNLGNDYLFLGMLKQALYFYEQALGLAVEGEDDTDRANAFWGTGIAYRQLEEFEQARVYLEKSLAIHVRANNAQLLPGLRNTLGWVLVSMHDFDKAEETLLTALSEAITLTQREHDQSLSCLNLAFLYFEKSQAVSTPEPGYLQQLAQAEEYAWRGIDLARQVEDNFNLGLLLAQMAEIKTIGQPDLSEGRQFFDQATEILKKIGSRDTLRRIHKQYAKALQKVGQIEEALEILKEGYQYFD